MDCRKSGSQTPAGLHRTYVGYVERCERKVTLSTPELFSAALHVSVPELPRHGQKTRDLSWGWGYSPAEAKNTQLPQELRSRFRIGPHLHSAHALHRRARGIVAC